jgi:hypothetical protein
MFRPFWKMEFDDWDEDTVDLSLEQEAALLRVANAMNRSQGPIPNSTRLLCSLWRCHPNKARHLLKRLLELGKVVVLDDGRLSNVSAMRQIESRQTLQGHRANVGHTGGIRSGEARRQQRDPSHTTGPNRLKTNGSSEAGALNQTKQNEPEKKREDTPPAPEGVGRISVRLACRQRSHTSGRSDIRQPGQT